MDLQTYFAKTELEVSGSDDGISPPSQTNFDDFIPEVYRIKNSCKGRLISTKMEEDSYSSDNSDTSVKTNILESTTLLFKNRKQNSRRRKDKPYKCSFCNFITAWKCNIIRHRQQHTREKVFGCHLCSYTALQKSNLRTHIRIHLGEKRFHCSLCDYKTMYKSTLDVHVLKHTRGKLINKSRKIKAEPTSEFGDTEEPVDTDAHTGEKNFKKELCDDEELEYKTEAVSDDEIDETLKDEVKKHQTTKWEFSGENTELEDFNNEQLDDVKVIELKPSEIDL